MSFGMMEALLSFLRRQVGLRTDTADPAGSLHGKVVDVKNNVTTVNNNVTTVNNKVVGWAAKQPRFAYTSTINLASGGSVTALSIAGTGFLVGFELNAADVDNNVKLRLVIVIDGTTRLDTDASGLANQYYIPSYDVARAFVSIPMLHRFNSSAGITVYNNDTYSLSHLRTVTSYVLD